MQGCNKRKRFQKWWLLEMEIKILQIPILKKIAFKATINEKNEKWLLKYPQTKWNEILFKDFLIWKSLFNKLTWTFLYERTNKIITHSLIIMKQWRKIKFMVIQIIDLIITQDWIDFRFNDLGIQYLKLLIIFHWCLRLKEQVYFLIPLKMTLKNQFLKQY